MGILRRVLSWGLALFLIAVFVHTTLHPLPNPPTGRVMLFDAAGENIIFQTLADKSGYLQFEPLARVLTAFIELFAAFLLLFPFSRRTGACISFLVMTAVVGLHLSPWLGREVPLQLGGSETDGGMLFSLAIAMLVASLLILIVHPGKRGEPE